MYVMTEGCSLMHWLHIVTQTHITACAEVLVLDGLSFVIESGALRRCPSWVGGNERAWSRCRWC